jgi:hypothetical protein
MPRGTFAMMPQAGQQWQQASQGGDSSPTQVRADVLLAARQQVAEHSTASIRAHCDVIDCTRLIQAFAVQVFNLGPCSC